MKHTTRVGSVRTHRLDIAIQRNRRTLRGHCASDYKPLLLFPELPLNTLQASVIIPAKNESDNIVKTLEALRLQRDKDGNALPFSLYEVLLLANNCGDDTYNIALAYQQRYPEFPLHIAEIELAKKQAHIGTARRLLMDEAFRRHGLNRHDGIILSTDGDTEVDALWITNTIKEMSSGYDAVGGRILARNVNPESKLYYLQDTAYRCLSARLEVMIDKDRGSMKGNHFQCFGASLAVRCSAYQKAGRLPVIPFLEDEAFSRALHRVDVRIKRSSAVKVYTSSRLVGRVAAGLSVHLSYLACMKKQAVAIHVEPLSTLIEKFTIRKQLRKCWQLRRKDPRSTYAACLYEVSNTAQLSPHWLMREMDISCFFGEFWEKAEQRMYSGEWGRRQQKAVIEKAISDLRRYLNHESA